MSKQRLTDKTSASSVSLNDIIHIVKTGDISQNPLGSSYKATVLQFASLIGGGSIFTGGTISGPTTFTNGLTANTISTNTLTVNGVTITNIGNFITGATYNSGTGVLTLLNTTGGTVNVSGFTTGGSGGDSYWTSGSTGNYSIKIINDSTTDATGNYGVAEGYNTKSIGDYSHVEGQETIAGWRGFTVDSVVNGLVTINSSYGDITSEFTGNKVIIDERICVYNTVTFSSTTNT